MSSYWAGYCGTALVLNEPEFLSFYNTYCSKHSDQPSLAQLEESETPIGDLSFTPSNPRANNFFITEILTDTCDGMTLIPYVRSDGTVNQNILDPQTKKWTQLEIRKEMRGQNCYIIFSDLDMIGPTAFLGPDHTYQSYQQLRSEFVDKLYRYLPSDFNWDDHIGIFSYAAYA